MAIRVDSYSSTGEVRAYTRHLLDGQSTFNSTTRPTLTDVEKFIDRASGTLNTALRGVGLAVPIANSTAKLACDDWVTTRAAEYVELTQRGVGYSDGEGSRTAAFRGLYSDAVTFAKQMKTGFEDLGVTVLNKASAGLQFTGLTTQADRTDPTDSSLEQPMFGRHMFDEPDSTRFGTNNQEDFGDD